MWLQNRQSSLVKSEQITFSKLFLLFSIKKMVILSLPIPWRHIGVAAVWPHFILTSAVDWCEGLNSCPVSFPPPTHWTGVLVSSISSFGKSKIFCLANIQTPNHPCCSLGALPTILFWFCLPHTINNKTVLTGMYSGRPSAMFSWAISAFSFFLWFGFFMPIAVRSCKRTNASIVMFSVISYPVSDIFNILDTPETYWTYQKHLSDSFACYVRL